MKKLALGALFVGLLAACGGGGDNNKIKIVDSKMVDTPMACNPLTQAGCATGEKCTWLLDALMPQYVGHVGCAPNGTANAGDACMYGAPGSAGFDNCVKGTVCGNYRGGAGTCKTICDQQGGTPMCDSTHVCVTYSGLFSTGDSTPAAGGVCDLACNPLTDNDFDGSASMSTKSTSTCGSAATVGCYGYPSYGTAPATGWSCTNDINYMESQPVGLRNRVQCTEANNCADPGPTIYVNSCNQGYLPLLRESTAVSTAICVAMCKPAVCYNGNCGTGTQPQANASNRWGEAPHQCNVTYRPGNYVTGVNHQHCQYLWWREVDDQGNLLKSPTSDSMGFCMDLSQYQYDSNNDNTPDTNYPDCNTLGSGFGSGSDPTMPATYWGAADLGCVPSSYLPAMAAGKQGVPSDAMQRRQRAMDDMPRALYRRTVGERN